MMENLLLLQLLCQWIPFPFSIRQHFINLSVDGDLGFFFMFLLL